jgi:pimeloyl-ACP methyl ester carboxylesterase
MALVKISAIAGMEFDVLVDGPQDTPLVLLLHGFAESFHTWDAQTAALARAGYCAVAPSQRGYSAGARPDPANTALYQFDHLVEDAVAIAAACGYPDRRFHLVGHDWGGSIAWGIADKRRKARAISSQPPTRSRSFPASGISPPIRCRIASANCCCGTLHSFQSEVQLSSQQLW